MLSTLAVNEPTERNVKTIWKENSASWVDLFYRLAPFKTPQNTLKYILILTILVDFSIYSGDLFVLRRNQLREKWLTLEKYIIAPALRINDNWTKRGLLCCTLPIILFQWLGNLRAIYKCNQLTFTCTLCHDQDRPEAHFFNYRSLCYAFRPNSKGVFAVSINTSAPTLSCASPCWEVIWVSCCVYRVEIVWLHPTWPSPTDMYAGGGRIPISRASHWPEAIYHVLLKAKWEINRIGHERSKFGENLTD